MPTPNYSEPWLLQFLQKLQNRVTNLERTFNGIKDPNGKTRVQWGQLFDSAGHPNGDYGIALTDSLGNTQELLPSVRSFWGPTLTVTSTTYSSPANSPSVTVVIGSSGDALITMSANIGITNVNDTAQVGLSIDGGAANDYLFLSSTASIIGASCSLQVSIKELIGSTLTPGSHTFTMAYKGSTAGHNFQFGGNSLVVEPT